MIPTTPSLRVLYLEDNPVDADLARRELARLAPEIVLEVATTLAVALERLTPAIPAYDIILTDLCLPDGSGLELLAHVRDRDLPLAVVIITGSGDQDAAVAALKAGADDYLVKRADYTSNLPRLLSAALARFQVTRNRRSSILRVLYAEPSVFDVDLTRRYLAQHARHIRLEAVGSGVEVLERLPMAPGGAALPCDVVLLDYRLPGLNALEVVKTLRQERGITIPIVLVTGHGNEDVAIQALRLGVDDYLIKHEGYLQQLPAILEKMQKQVELGQSEARYHSLFENNHATMLLIDPVDGQIVDANPAACSYYGYDPEVLRGMNITVINNLSPEQVKEEMTLVRSMTRNHFDFRHRLASGEVRDVEVYSGPIEISGQKLLYSIIHDVTERRLAEEALRKSEAKFREMSAQFHALLDAIPDNITLQSPDLKVLWSNSGAAAGLHKGREQVVGQYCYNLWHDRNEPCKPCPVLQSFRTGEPAAETVVTPDSRTWELRTIPVMEEGRVVSVIEVGRDVSEQRKIEGQLHQSQKMESIGTLAGGVAHDFNNILTAIIGYGYMALRKMAQDDPQRLTIEHILEAADRAAHLTKDLLLFSRKQVIDRKPVDLNVVVAKVEKFLKRVIGEDIECKTVLQEVKLPVMADAYQLEQVLMNLATNARDAMPHGGTLTVTTETVQLNEDFTGAHGFGKPGHYALITVSDSGEGMDEKTRQRIFEPFFTTKEVGKGTGLGLAVVYGIIKQHEGFINVYSEAGSGTTFRIYLPVIHPQTGEETGLYQQEAPVGGGETILLAEDDESVRDLTRTILSEFGYTVIEAVDGEDAVQKFMANQDAIDLLLFDLIMPKMNGKEAYDKILIIRPEVKAIFASGYAPDIIRQKAAVENGVMIVSKPAHPAELLRKVRNVLDGK